MASKTMSSSAGDVRLLVFDCVSLCLTVLDCVTMRLWRESSPHAFGILLMHTNNPPEAGSKKHHKWNALPFCDKKAPVRELQGFFFVIFIWKRLKLKFHLRSWRGMTPPNTKRYYRRNKGSGKQNKRVWIEERAKREREKPCGYYQDSGLPGAAGGFVDWSQKIFTQLTQPLLITCNARSRNYPHLNIISLFSLALPLKHVET